MKKLSLAPEKIADIALEMTKMALERKSPVTTNISDLATQVRDAFQKNVELLQGGDEGK